MAKWTGTGAYRCQTRVFMSDHPHPINRHARSYAKGRAVGSTYGVWSTMYRVEHSEASQWLDNYAVPFLNVRPSLGHGLQMGRWLV